MAAVVFEARIMKEVDDGGGSGYGLSTYELCTTKRFITLEKAIDYAKDFLLDKKNQPNPWYPIYRADIYRVKTFEDLRKEEFIRSLFRYHAEQ
jgi:hypothetical protein